MDQPKKNLAVDVKSLSKRFGSKQALRDITFSVEEGTSFGFLGPNGAGKTTTIRCLMDYIRPDHGQVTLFGQDARAHSAELKRQVGYLSSDMQLYSNWTGHEHLSLIEGVRGRSDQSRRLASELDLDLSRRVKHLSSGNKQKLAIVLAFAGHPKLLILDEPTRGLDPLLQNQLYDLLRDFTTSGGTVFFSSHNLAEVQRLCDGVVIIREGSVVAERSMADLRDLQLYLIEAVTTNPLHADLFKHAGVTVVHHSAHEISLRVQGDINPIVHALAKFHLKDLQVTHADLEDIFMEFYQ
jgi:ABC-2 type transport system ATP-binding protein